MKKKRRNKRNKKGTCTRRRCGGRERISFPLLLSQPVYYYHLVWSTKYCRKVLLPPLDETLKAVITALCVEHGSELLALEVRPDHVHVFPSVPPKIAPAVIAEVLKGSPARALFTKYAELRKKLWGGHLWNPSYCVGTAGQIFRETIRRYIEIEAQKTEKGYG